MQTIKISSRFCRYAHRVSMACAGVTAVAGGTAFFGWMLGSGRLIRLGFSDDAAVFALAADAAVAVLLAGMVLLLHQDVAAGRLRRRVASACALGVLLLGGMGLADAMLSTSFGLGGWFATEAFGETSCMTRSEAVALTLLGAALFWRDAALRRLRPSEWLAIIVFLVSLNSLLTFFCGIHWPAAVGAVLVIGSPVSTVSLLLLSLALFLARPGRRQLFTISEPGLPPPAVPRAQPGPSA
jgi:hypothetical protein